MFTKRLFGFDWLKSSEIALSLMILLVAIAGLLYFGGILRRTLCRKPEEHS